MHYGCTALLTSCLETHFGKSSEQSCLPCDSITPRDLSRGTCRSSTCYGITWIPLGVTESKGVLMLARTLPARSAIRRFMASRGKNQPIKDKRTFWVQQCLLLPALLDPIDCHKAWQAMKSISTSVEVKPTNNWLRKRYPEIFRLKSLSVLLSSPMRMCVMPSFRSFVRRAPANLAVLQACFVLQSEMLFIGEASLASRRSV